MWLCGLAPRIHRIRWDCWIHIEKGSRFFFDSYTYVYLPQRSKINPHVGEWDEICPMYPMFFFNLAWFWEAKALQHMNIDPVVLGLDHQMGPMFGRWNKLPMCQCVVIFCHVPSTWCVVWIGVSCNRSLPPKNARNAMLFRWDLQAYWRVCKLRMHFFSQNMCHICVPHGLGRLPIHEWHEFIVNVDKYSNPIATLGTMLFYASYLDWFEVIFYFVPWEHHPEKHPFGRIPSILCKSKLRGTLKYIPQRVSQAKGPKRWTLDEFLFKKR